MISIVSDEDEFDINLDESLSPILEFIEQLKFSQSERS